MQIELDAQDVDLIAEILEATLRELHVEMRRTETSDVKIDLKRREARLAGILARLRGGAAEAP